MARLETFTKHKRNKYFKNVLSIMGMSEDEYAIYFFNLGCKHIEYSQKISPNALKAKIYWEVLEINFLIFINDNHGDLLGGKPITENQKEKYAFLEYHFLTNLEDNFILNKVDKSEIINKYNQLKSNLNTI